MKNVINRNNVLNGIKLAAVAIIFQTVLTTTPATASFVNAPVEVAQNASS